MADIEEQAQKRFERIVEQMAVIDMGFSAVAIADRVGHESIDITYQYAHLFPSKQTEMADRLDDLGKGEIENVS